jgi:hypothetical protein
MILPRTASLDGRDGFVYLQYEEVLPAGLNAQGFGAIDNPHGTCDLVNSSKLRASSGWKANFQIRRIGAESGSQNGLPDDGLLVGTGSGTTTTEESSQGAATRFGLCEESNSPIVTHFLEGEVGEARHRALVLIDSPFDAVKVVIGTI